jgi:betaine-aldehyde dehydrogenase
MSTQFGDRPMYIGGEFVPSDSGEWMDSINPATGEVHGRVPAGTVSDVDRAVKAAAAAQLDWGAKSVWERGALLRKLAEAIQARAADVLPMESADTGNTIASLDNDITLACAYINFVAGLGIEIKGESVPATAENIHFTMRQPYGVVGLIVPFNHPFLFAAAHLGAPLIAASVLPARCRQVWPFSAQRPKLRSSTLPWNWAERTRLLRSRMRIP